MASKNHRKLPIPLLAVQRQDGDTITLVTNHLQRSAVEVAARYKGRWQIELLFRWINIRKFLVTNDNAIRLQLFAAMIAYALRIAARACRISMPILRSPIWSSDVSSNAETSPPSTNRPRQPKSTQANFLGKPDELHRCMTFPGQPCSRWMLWQAPVFSGRNSSKFLSQRWRLAVERRRHASASLEEKQTLVVELLASSVCVAGGAAARHQCEPVVHVAPADVCVGVGGFAAGIDLD